MTIVTVTKAQVIKALREEPLSPGNFESRDWCRVCAVGAVLRHTVSSLDISINGFRVCGEMDLTWEEMGAIPKLVAEDKWMNVLSISFEYLASECLDNAVVPRKVRNELIELVEDTFPDSFEFSV